MRRTKHSASQTSSVLRLAVVFICMFTGFVDRPHPHASSYDHQRTIVKKTVSHTGLHPCASKRHEAEGERKKRRARKKERKRHGAGIVGFLTV